MNKDMSWKMVFKRDLENVNQLDSFIDISLIKFVIY